MPELPEVETVLRTLREGGLFGLRALAVEVAHGDAVRHPDAETFRRLLQGARFCEGHRRGKYLLFEMSSGRTLVAHLRMTGRLWLSAATADSLPHTHVVFVLSDGRELRFRDVRRFGGFYLVDATGQGLPAGLKTLGPEPWDLTAAALRKWAARRPRTPIKSLLLDQRVVAGLGNIYADEALFLAQVHPAKACGSLTAKEAGRIVHAIGDVLTQALANRGTTFLDFRDGAGEPGEFAQFLCVYGREGKPCRVCGRPIQKIRLGGRGTHCCPVCQKGRKLVRTFAPLPIKAKNRRAKTWTS